MIIPVILAGGSGTRLWPLSRSLYPKQFMRLLNQRTLLQNTLLRLNELQGVQPPIILCNEEHRFIVAEQMREIGISPDAIILEPAGRNTAPALAVAALMASARYDNPVLLALPADHHIENHRNFIETIANAVYYAEQGRLVTFGILPHAPETGYGYIRKGEAVALGGAKISEPCVRAWEIAQFVEKPDLARAKTYLASGNYCWNSGMFMFSCDNLLEELQSHVPKIVEDCRKAVEGGREDLDFFRLSKAAFCACPSDSIDYAVMEKTRHGVMVALDSGWSDLGSWEALWQAGNKDQSRNVVQGDVYLQNVQDSFVHASSRLVAAVGLSQHVVVETQDAVFVAPRDQTEEGF